MKAVRTSRNPAVRRLPAPPSQREDRVNDLGWFSRGPTKRAEREAAEGIAGLLLADGEESGLPPDPSEPPPLPEPPIQRPDVDSRGGGEGNTKRR